MYKMLPKRVLRYTTLSHPLIASHHQEEIALAQRLDNDLISADAVWDNLALRIYSTAPSLGFIRYIMSHDAMLNANVNTNLFILFAKHNDSEKLALLLDHPRISVAQITQIICASSTKINFSNFIKCIGRAGDIDGIIEQLPMFGGGTHLFSNLTTNLHISLTQLHQITSWFVDAGLSGVVDDLLKVVKITLSLKTITEPVADMAATESGSETKSTKPISDDNIAEGEAEISDDSVLSDVNAQEASPVISSYYYDD